MTANAFTIIFDPNFEFPVSLFIFQFSHAFFLFLLLLLALFRAFNLDVGFGHQNLSAFVKAASTAGVMRFDRRQAFGADTWFGCAEKFVGAGRAYSRTAAPMSWNWHRVKLKVLS